MQIKDWNQNVRSQPKSFDIIQGSKLWEQEIGVPDSASGANATPEIRKFVLQQANYLKSQLRLYVRLTDASGSKTFRVFPIGPMVSFGRPEPQVDKFSNMHLLHQSGPHSYTYIVINPDGEIIARRTYDYVDKRPRLMPDTEGKVLVDGRRAAPHLQRHPTFQARECRSGHAQTQTFARRDDAPGALSGLRLFTRLSPASLSATAESCPQWPPDPGARNHDAPCQSRGNPRAVKCSRPSGLPRHPATFR